MKHGKDGWLELDPATDMSTAQREAYEAYKAKYAEAKVLRDRYEASMSAAAPAGKAFVFGYNFGKASLKIVAAGEVRAKAAKPTLALEDYLGEMARAGRLA